MHLQWTPMMAVWDDETNKTSNSDDSDLQSDSLKSEFWFEWNYIHNLYPLL